MRRIATTSRSTLARPARTAVARSAVRVCSSGPLNSRTPPGLAVESRAFATAVASLHTAGSASSSPSHLARKPLFSKVLIANRGEIAVRIMRTCKKLGIKTVAVFSEADRNAMHVKMADEAYLLGPAPSHLSYLNIPRLLEVCHLSGAQAVHPGYGFMSENAEFARSLEKEGIVFIGPGVEAIISMGSKAESKDIMKAADVPCIPGWHPSTTGKTVQDPSVDTQSAEFLVLEADKIGYPVLIKAVSGGGGKGMKIVENRDEFASQLESAKREGRKSFGDDTVLLEKYVTKPRHVEVQIFSDSHGNHLSLFERDCSVQRRHQKVIEEAPAPNLSQEVRDKLYETARKAARAVGYRGAGTVEFVLNADKPEEFFFLEVNTRLQVEHPVTEAITGVDLVEWQLEVAAGNPIPLKQEEITCTGHAFEVRVYAENPRNNFLPDTGTLLHVKTPQESQYVRLETGFEAGDEISVFYDPLIAKLIVHGPNRREALKRLRKALGEYQIVGPSTNLEFLTRLSENEAFAEEDLDTGFIPRHHDSLFPPLAAPSASTLASTALYLASREISQYTALNSTDSWSSSRLAGFRLGESEGNRYQRTYETSHGRVQVQRSLGGDGRFDVSLAEGGTSMLDVHPEIISSTGTSHTVTSLLSAQLAQVDIVSSEPTTTQVLEQRVGENLYVFNEAESYAGTIEVNRPSWMKHVGQARGGAGAQGGAGARAPMPSKIVEVKVKVGDRVEAGQQLVVVEAMKMEHVLKASKAGVVSKVSATEGDLVKEGQLLVEFEAEAQDAAKAE
ncbi:acetyl/propionyl/methylcrotonyl-CoA carboxylase subunit alpha [Sporobolomyces koalae]|uniref:acetyl/propionyl/methylcrotonyl-CoA carboxylase subunit alpha n=1 Tax=Sporobolomyces koalae TaxID=500713 RepID=UPI0031759D0C